MKHLSEVGNVNWSEVLLNRVLLLLINVDKSKLGKDSNFSLEILSEQRHSLLELKTSCSTGS